jgi:primosomal replication protein N
MPVLWTVGVDEGFPVVGSPSDQLFGFGTGSKRQVKVEIRAVAFGADAETLARQAIGSGFRFTGFLAAFRGGKHPVLHIQSFEQDKI